MNIIIAGSRTIQMLTPQWFEDTFKQFGIDIFNETQLVSVISGTANGVDRLGEKFAEFYDIPIKRFPADWDKNGKAAGHIRNKQMANVADALFLVWDGKSRGSANMKENMTKLNKQVYEVIIKKCNKF